MCCSGDLMYKNPEYTDKRISGVNAEPHLASLVLSDNDDFIIMGCDGLWDVFKYEVRFYDIWRYPSSSSGFSLSLSIGFFESVGGSRVCIRTTKAYQRPSSRVRRVGQGG